MGQTIYKRLGYRPILAKAYLHELDEFVEGLRVKLEMGKRKSNAPLDAARLVSSPGRKEALSLVAKKA